MIFFLLIFPLCVGIQTGIEAEVEIALEAELAQTIEEPMIVADDKLASDGKFIWMEGAAATGGGGTAMQSLASRFLNRGNTRSGDMSLPGMETAIRFG